MIRMLIPLVVIFLLYLLARTIMEGTREEPIDVDPIDASSENEAAREGRDTPRNRTARHADDDVIDVEPVVSSRDGDSR